MFRSLCSGYRPALALLLCGAFATATAAPVELNAAERAWVARHPLVSYLPERDYGPFVYLDGAGAVRGLSIDFLAAIGAKRRRNGGRPTGPGRRPDSGSAN